ncbi:hypothetical protein ANN_26016 [Periplaneta americana]|uniref:Uncharacterized protein n=1 Tax=Periplaneta americana TaxID=6978 RepID=A0ABQ8S5A8_PERAM|nr:hypothetical protein ANN_26016 [Periplaneta americana]
MLGENPQTIRENTKFYLKQVKIVVITEDVQNVHLLLEYRPHIDVSLTCEHDPKLQEYCVCPQNMPQFDSEGIPNQAPETNKPMILNGPTSRNREVQISNVNIVRRMFETGDRESDETTSSESGEARTAKLEDLKYELPIPVLIQYR